MDSIEDQNKDQKSVEVIISDDGMVGYLKLIRNTDGHVKPTKADLMDALGEEKITTGIKEASVEKLAMRPIFNIKIEVARGRAPINGEDGQVHYYVKRDSEYEPEYSEEGNVDYKNLDYFQMVEKGQLLCDIKKETEGIDGINIFGKGIPARRGRRPENPQGKNTEYVDDETRLIASCDGVVRFLRDTIEVNDMLKINGSVNQLSGNIDFSGDVTIEGDVCDGFSVKSGGNIIVKGVVEGAFIEAAGNVHISKGINGGGKEGIHVGKDLRCRYIENATLKVDGDISADYIIDSKIVCLGNIELQGPNELVVGGDIKVLGLMRSKDIGTEKERITRIEVMGMKAIDIGAIEKMKAEIQAIQEQAKTLMEAATQYADQLKSGRDSHLLGLLDTTMKQVVSLKERMDYNVDQVKKLEDSWVMDYHGAIECKRKLYQGVKINFGEAKFRFNLDNIEHCRIYWHNGEIIQSTL